MSRKFMRLLVSLAMLAGLFAVANPAQADTDDDEGSVIGRAVDADDDPIANVFVSVYEDVTDPETLIGVDLTGADGEFDIQDIPLADAPPSATVDVELNGFLVSTVQFLDEDITETAEPPDEGVLDLGDVEMEPGAAVFGQVTDFDPDDSEGAPDPVDQFGCVEALLVLADDNGFSSPNVVEAVVPVVWNEAQSRGEYVFFDVPSEPLTVAFRDCDPSGDEEGEQLEEDRFRPEIWNNNTIFPDATFPDDEEQKTVVEADLTGESFTEAVDVDAAANPLLVLPGDQPGRANAELARGAGPGGSHCGVAPFPDVSASNIFCDDIYWMAELLITGGFDDGEFKSANPISRQAMAAFLFRYVEGPGEEADECTEAPFDDVPVSHTFCPEIAWLAESDISEGFDTGDYQPAAPVTRQAMAAFLYRLEHGGTNPVPVTCTSAPFVDVPADSEFCAHIEWLDETEVTTGYDDGTFRPASAISRQAMSAFLHRLWNLPA